MPSQGRVADTLENPSGSILATHCPSIDVANQQMQNPRPRHRGQGDQIEVRQIVRSGQHRPAPVLRHAGRDKGSSMRLPIRPHLRRAGQRANEDEWNLMLGFSCIVPTQYLRSMRSLAPIPVSVGRNDMHWKIESRPLALDFQKFPPKALDSEEHMF